MTSCGCCHDELRTTTFHEPPHDITHHQASAEREDNLSPAAESLIRQLEAVAQAGGLVEHPERPQVVNVTTYYLRNQDVVDASDELLAFQVNASAGTQDTVDKARIKGIPVAVFTFEAASDPPP